jgi:protease-4
VSRGARLGRALVVVLGALVAAIVGVVLFVQLPEGSLTRLLGILLALATILVGARIAGRAAWRRFPDYNVAEVAVKGPIVRDGGSSGFPTGGILHGADDIVEQIDAANEDPHARALLLHLNTPGGEVVPSDDLRLAAERFEGPTIAYTTDVCASGGYWIASACDELWAREGSIVGSIGVRGSRFTVPDLMERLGVEYEQLTAGAFKEAGVPFTNLDEDERAYLQELIDDYYDQFVEVVAEGRDMDPAFVRETEARVYLGGEALDQGLVDALGTREEVEDHLEELLGEEVSVVEFRPHRRLTERIQLGARGLAYSFGAGLAGVFSDDGPRLRL